MGEGASGGTAGVGNAGGSPPWVVWALLLGGLVLVAFSYPLGQICVQHDAPGGTHWSPDDADRAALVLRCLGAWHSRGACWSA